MNARNRWTASCLVLIWASFSAVGHAEKISNTEQGVDVARFARVLFWDPKVMEGTKASRSDEMPAEDIAPYKEILPSSENTYTVPVIEGTGGIGLQWAENRLLRQVELEFTRASGIPSADSIELQYWTGESAWQGKWQPAKIVPEQNDNRLAWRFAEGLPVPGTQKVRWVFSNVQSPIVLKTISAFTQSEWNTVEVRVEPIRTEPAQKAEIEIYNGAFIDSNQGISYHCTWDGTKPLVFKVQASASRPFKADRTVLRFKMPEAAFGVAVEDLLARDCVYVPHANLFVTRNPPPISLAEYRKKIAAQKTTIEEVRQRPDQELHRAVAAIHNPTQDRHNWVPTLISLACDNRKFLVFREGAVVLNEYQQPDDYPGESDGVHTTAANIGQWRFVPSFGSGEPLEIARNLHSGWLPMPVTIARDKKVSYRQTTFVAPIDEPIADKPAWFSERALGGIEYLVKNEGTEPASVRLSIRFAPEQDPTKTVQYREVKQGIAAMSGDRVLAFLGQPATAPLAWKVEPTGVVLSGTLPGGGENACSVYFPAWKATAEDLVLVQKGAPWSPRVEKYWRSLLEPAMQINIPDELLGNLIRASQVHCLLAARNQERSKYIVPWISSVHFAYPESEANSVIRGMDMAGHPEFARRGLEFYLKECNPTGYITILVHNKVAGVSVGYTMVGTGEVLWTLGEHYERTRDKEWLRKVAPDVARICQWIVRQRAKTKRLNARGERVPEYGLMPPGVSADWNRFAYRFFNEAQYGRGLEKAGWALADIGNPAAPAILEDAKQYREDIVQAYHAMQAKMPVVPLKDGTWVPADPSLLGCYGNVEDFMPGEDVSRSYVYSVELGANHLAANEIIDPASKGAKWMVDYLEDVQFLARKQWYKDMSSVDPFDWGGFAKMQPYYCRVADIHAKRDDVKPFLRSYFNPIPALVNFEDLTFWEDMGTTGYATGAWNKTHEAGWFLGQTRTMFATERGEDLWLAPFVTSTWLKDGQKVAAHNVPTRFGKIGYTITSNVGKGEIEAVVQLPEKCTAKHVVLRLRHPEGKPIQSVTVQRKAHEDFDPQKETITFVPDGETITVRAKYY